MSQSPVTSPNVEQLRKQAKELLKAAQRGDADAAVRFNRHHPHYQDPGNLKVESPKLAAAQLVVARENGFPSWPRLISAYALPKRRYIPFEEDISYYADRAEGVLSAWRDGQENILEQIRQLHPRFAGFTVEQIRSTDLNADDARLIVAREHGCETWGRFEEYIAGLASGKLNEPFMFAFAAIKEDRIEALRPLLESDPGLASAVGTNSTTLMNLAVSCRRLDALEMLISAGGDVNIPNRYGVTPLHSAAYFGNTGMVDMLLRAGARVDIEARGSGGTPIMQALFWGHLESARRIADVKVAPLNLRVAAGLGRMDLVTAFFDSNGLLNPEAGNKRGYYRPHPGFLPWKPSDDSQEIIDEAFVYTCKTGQVEVMEFLLARGAEIDAEPYNATGLMWAVHCAGHNGDRSIVWLLDRGANINRIANFGGVVGLTALHVAAWGGQTEVARLLMDRGADIGIRDPIYHGLPCGWAEYHGQTETRDFLWEAGSKNNIFYAIAAGRLDRIEEILDANPGLINESDGWTRPLNAAASRGKKKTVQLLLERGADPQLKDGEGQTAVQAATASGHPEVAALIAGWSTKR